MLTGDENGFALCLWICSPQLPLSTHRETRNRPQTNFLNLIKENRMKELFAGALREPPIKIKLTPNAVWDKTSTVGCWVSVPPWLKPPEFLWTMKLSFILQAWHQMREEGPGLSPTVAVIYLLCEGTSISGGDRERMQWERVRSLGLTLSHHSQRVPLYLSVAFLYLAFSLALPLLLLSSQPLATVWPPFVKITGPAQVFFLLKRFLAVSACFCEHEKD